jgi:hypothetical protein
MLVPISQATLCHIAKDDLRTISAATNLHGSVARSFQITVTLKKIFFSPTASTYISSCYIASIISNLSVHKTLQDPS